MTSKKKKAEAKMNKAPETDVVAILKETVDAETIVLGRASSGGTWYKDTKTGTCYRWHEGAIAEVRESKSTRMKMLRPKTTEIVCENCGAKRTVATQDAFQAKRCAPCQKKHRNRKRAELAKRRRAQRRQERLLAILNKDNK